MKTKTLFTPLFTLFFYSHSPEEYEKSRKKFNDRWFKDFRYDGENKNLYENAKQNQKNLFRIYWKEKEASPIP